MLLQNSSNIPNFINSSKMINCRFVVSYCTGENRFDNERETFLKIKNISVKNYDKSKNHTIEIEHLDDSKSTMVYSNGYVTLSPMLKGIEPIIGTILEMLHEKYSEKLRDEFYFHMLI